MMGSSIAKSMLTLAQGADPEASGGMGAFSSILRGKKGVAAGAGVLMGTSAALGNLKGGTTISNAAPNMSGMNGGSSTYLQPNGAGYDTTKSPKMNTRVGNNPDSKIFLPTHKKKSMLTDLRKVTGLVLPGADM